MLLNKIYQETRFPSLSTQRKLTGMTKPVTFICLHYFSIFGLFYEQSNLWPVVLVWDDLEKVQ